MHWALIVALPVLAIIGLFVWGKRRTEKKHAVFTKRDVASAIENVLADGDHDEWDLFLAWPVADSYLESVRKRCIAISEEYSGIEKGKDIASKGETRLHEILDELRSRA